MKLILSFITVALLIAMVQLPAPTSAAEGAAVSLDELGNLGGSTQAVAVSTPIVLLGEGTNLVTAELIAGRTPRIRARLALPGHPQAITIAGAGTLAFVKTAAYSDGYEQSMQVVDIQDLSRPKLIGSYPTPVIPDADGRILYVAEFDGLHIVDVTDPMQPVERGGYSVPMYPRQVVFYLSILTIAESSRLHLIDVADPSQPTLLGQYEFPTIINQVILKDALAYVVGGTLLQVVDISDPRAPVLRQQITLPQTARAMTSDATTIYITATQSTNFFDRPTTLLLVDISELTAPVLRGSYEVPSGIIDVVPAVDVTLVAANDQGLLVLDTNQPDQPILRGQYNPSGTIGDLQFDRLAYLAVDGRGLEIVAVNEASPSLVGALHLLGYPHNIRVAGGLAAVYDDTSLWILDLRILSKPLAIYRAELGGSSAELSAPWIDSNGHLIYVGYQHTAQVGDQAIQQIDILIIDTSLQPPLVVGRTTIPLLAGAHYARFARVNNTILVASGTDEVVLINISDPLQPTRVGTLFVPTARDVQGVGMRAYILGSEGEIRTFEFDVEERVHLLGVYEANGVVTAMRVVGTQLYLSDEAGFEIVDLASPTTPQRSDVIPDGVWATQIDIVSDRAYLTRFGYVYLLGNSATITTIAVDDRSHPKLLGQIYYGSGRAVAFKGPVWVVVSGQRYPTIPHNGHLSIYRSICVGDSVWVNGRELFSPPTDVAVEDTRIYVADAASGLRIYSFGFVTYLPFIEGL